MRVRVFDAAALCLIFLLACAAAARAQGSRDFLFGEPRASIGVRGSWVFAREGSDIFSFVKQQLTIDDGDFNAPAIAADVGIAIARRVEIVGGVEFSRTAMRSEYRNFVDNDRRPIEQDTQLRGLDLSASLRIALAPRGRGVSRLAWVPSRATPYVGAGGGMLWYQFTQQGDFIDALAPSPPPVFFDRFESKGHTPSAHVFGGVDVRLFRGLMGTVEGRYLWANAPLGRSYENFDPIDLAGFRMSAGINMLF
jgi:hypothetical protein